MDDKEYLDLIDRACTARSILNWMAGEGSLDGIGTGHPHPSITFDECARTVSDLIGVLNRYQSYVLKERLAWK